MTFQRLISSPLDFLLRLTNCTPDRSHDHFPSAELYTRKNERWLPLSYCKYSSYSLLSLITPCSPFFGVGHLKIQSAPLLFPIIVVIVMITSTHRDLADLGSIAGERHLFHIQIICFELLLLSWPCTAIPSHRLCRLTWSSRLCCQATCGEHRPAVDRQP